MLVKIESFSRSDIEMDLGLALTLIALVGLFSFAMTKIKPKFWVFKIVFGGIIVACVNAFIGPFQPNEAAWFLINGVTVCLIGWNVCTTQTKGSFIIGLVVIALGAAFLLGGVSIIADTPLGRNVSELVQIVSGGWNQFMDRGGSLLTPS